MSGIDIRVDEHDLAEVLARVDATPRQIERASISAINRTTAWAHTQARREIARRHRIPVRALTQRNRLVMRRAQRGRLAGRLWIGTVPMRAAYVGALRQTTRGARAGRHSFPGAFIATMASGHRGVFERAGRKRLPIVEQTVDLDQAPAVLRGLLGRVRLRLRDEMATQLNYQVNVRGASR